MKYDSFQEDRDLHKRPYTRPALTEAQRVQRLKNIHTSVSAWRIPEVEEPPADFTVEEAMELAGSAVFEVVSVERVAQYRAKKGRARSTARRKERREAQKLEVEERVHENAERLVWAEEWDLQAEEARDRVAQREQAEQDRLRQQVLERIEAQREVLMRRITRYSHKLYGGNRRGKSDADSNK